MVLPLVLGAITAAGGIYGAAEAGLAGRDLIGGFGSGAGRVWGGFAGGIFSGLGTQPQPPPSPQSGAPAVPPIVIKGEDAARFAAGAITGIGGTLALERYGPTIKEKVRAAVAKRKRKKKAKQKRKKKRKR